jgi:hypothetical protein
MHYMVVLHVLVLVEFVLKAILILLPTESTGILWHHFLIIVLRCSSILELCLLNTIILNRTHLANSISGILPISWSVSKFSFQKSWNILIRERFSSAKLLLLSSIWAWNISRYGCEVSDIDCTCCLSIGDHALFLHAKVICSKRFQVTWTPLNNHTGIKSVNTWDSIEWRVFER